MTTSEKYSEMSKRNSKMRLAVQNGKITAEEYVKWFDDNFHPVIIEMSQKIMQDQIDMMSDDEFQSFSKLID